MSNLQIPVQFHFEIDENTDVISITEEIAENVFITLKGENTIEGIYELCKQMCDERVAQDTCLIPGIEDSENAVYIDCKRSNGYLEFGSFCQLVENHYNKFGVYPKVAII